ncbi:PAQR family membrane homeostasis protein TrhA [Bombilactobacillus thymidiniphilus]|uniref:Hemolysin III family protein n=1 Tax=Bombilactobacillus thymidiniphilus TaxID=2923363 RepID=A0ABY4PEK0_9LACO|nr:hemolysin III family protein [Bombilactobacillus thymidiniphilus]UQS83712.1 hemolysin III family protein [Bombilactobacillus thymidiniphilus]
MNKLFATPQTTTKVYRITNEVFSAITHGIGIILAVTGTVLLLIKACTQPHISTAQVISYIIYSFTLIFLYLCSTLFHSLYFTKARHVFQILDHSSIFLLIAGTYTPYCVLGIPKPMNWLLLSIIWLITIGGIIYKSFNIGNHPIIDTALYVIMGWMVILAMKPLHKSLGSTGIALLFWGGVAFTVGALLYTMRGLKYIHVIWHVVVMIGTTLMFLSVYLYL